MYMYTYMHIYTYIRTHTRTRTQTQTRPAVLLILSERESARENLPAAWCAGDCERETQNQCATAPQV
jgi:hypothetical protein